MGPGGGGGLQPVLMQPVPELSFKTWGGGGQLGGEVQPGVGGGGSCRGSGGGSGRGSGGRPARGEGVGVRVRVTELVEPVLVL